MNGKQALTVQLCIVPAETHIFSFVIIFMTPSASFPNLSFTAQSLRGRNTIQHIPTPSQILGILRLLFQSCRSALVQEQTWIEFLKAAARSSPHSDKCCEFSKAESFLLGKQLWHLKIRFSVAVWDQQSSDSGKGQTHLRGILLTALLSPGLHSLTRNSAEHHQTDI